MGIVSTFLDIRKCSPEDLRVVLEAENEIREEGEPSPGPLRCRSEDVCLCVEMSVSFKVIGCDDYFGNDCRSSVWLS